MAAARRPTDDGDDDDDGYNPSPSEPALARVTRARAFDDYFYTAGASGRQPARVFSWTASLTSKRRSRRRGTRADERRRRFPSSRRLKHQWPRARTSAQNKAAACRSYQRAARCLPPSPPSNFRLLPPRRLARARALLLVAIRIAPIQIERSPSVAAAVAAAVAVAVCVRICTRQRPFGGFAGGGNRRLPFVSRRVAAAKRDDSKCGCASSKEEERAPVFFAAAQIVDSCRRQRASFVFGRSPRNVWPHCSQ